MLPVSIQSKIEQYLHEMPRGELKARVKQFQTEYRQSKIGKNDPISDLIAALAYACVRMPATYQAAHHVLNVFNQKIDDKNITSCLDMGSGTGAILYQLQQSFPDADMTALEPNEYMRHFAAEFCNNSAVEWISTTVKNIDQQKTYDLITLGYVLNEVKHDLHASLESIWRATQKYLIIIETGSPTGFEIITTARDYILKNGGHIVAPCTHQNSCPLQGNATRWCHFEERVHRSRIHKELKEDAARGYEDEPFTYLIASRAPLINTENMARLISRVHGTKVLSADLCAADGRIIKASVSRKDELFSSLRRAEWGDEINVPAVRPERLPE